MAVVVIFIGAVVFKLTRPVHHYSRPGPNRAWSSGVYAGHTPAQDEAFARWRSAAIDTATDFIGSGTWLQITHPLLLSLAWRQDQQVQLVLSVPMWPAAGGNLTDAAAGKYDSYYRALAATLVRVGRANTVVRLGWEFNTPYFRWKVTTPTGARQFAVAWQKAVVAMRAVPGEKFSFVWNPNLSNVGPDPGLAYPGDAYVDDIGLDVYDRSLQPGANAAQRWSDLVNQRYGLQWQAQFAAAHGKPIAFPEWGLVHQQGSQKAGEDDPDFIRRMHDWFAAHNTAFEDYFDVAADGAQFALDSGDFPKAAAVYRRLFGN